MWKFALVILATLAPGQEAPLPDRIDNSTPAATQLRLIGEAAPADVVSNASAYVLEKDGYRLVRTGSNGFTCLIAREFKDTLEPECFDAVGSATLLAAGSASQKLTPWFVVRIPVT